MKTICVLQHSEAEYLGLMEDHFEGRNIRFIYQRPFATGGTIPADREDYDGLILLGGGPYGVVSGHLLPSFTPELSLTKSFLEAELPVIGIGIGALILTIAAGGGAEEAPLRFSIEQAISQIPGALDGHLPDHFPFAIYLRDRPVLPEGTQILAASPDGTPLIYQIGDNVLGLIGHPGMKSGMAEDIVMEFAETPPGTAETLADLRATQGEIATALTEIMVGINKLTGWL